VLSILRIAASALTIVCLGGLTAHADDRAAEVRLQAAYVAAYNLNHDEAARELRSLIELEPELPTTYRALASITWLRLLFSRGTVLVDEYLGKVSRRDVQLGPPPVEVSQAFGNYLSTAITLAEARIARRPNDARALYELSSALGLQASYAATVEGRMGRAFGFARRAYRTAERAVELAPTAAEPRLILGTYRYVVAGLNLPARMVAYLAGMDGDRTRGLQLVEQAATSAQSEVQTEARFALVLLYNREKRWDDALRVLAQLRERYPQNRLLWLETGATQVRAGRPGEAERWLSEGIEMTARDTRRRMYGEEALWRLKRGLARRLTGRIAEAREDLLIGLAAPEARDWVRGRSHLEFAEVSLALGDREQARWQAEKALPLLQRGNDAEGLRAGRQLLERLSRG
jgi:tetratricopeptide (TPR) repeat protein